jgi:hypothetical protein
MPPKGKVKKGKKADDEDFWYDVLALINRLHQSPS